MFYSIVQIGPEVIYNTTNIASSAPPSNMNYGLLESMVVVLAGSLIFLSLGIKFDFIRLTYHTEFHKEKSGIDLHALINSITLLIFFGSILLAIIMSLYTEWVPFAKVAFIYSLVFLGAFVFKNILERA